MANTSEENGTKNNNAAIPIPCSIPGKHSFSARGSTFTVDTKYKIIKPIGVGAYGLVMSAIDTTSGRAVAIKKISAVFDDLVDAKRVLREIRLMRVLRHENILPLVDMEAPESTQFDDVYIVSPLYDKDLGKILAANVKLSSAHKQYFVYQILCALKYLHSASILHRDLKPANILIQESCDLALCDFGLARYVGMEEGSQQGMTEYVVTRWYRAPELVLTHSYTSAVDLWAVGCILAELLGGKVLFPGRDFKHQVETICAVIGKPKEEDLEHVTSSRARKFLEGLPEVEGVRFEELFAGAEAEAVDLMKGLLQFDPKKRLTADEALRHAYVREFYEGVEENVGDEWKELEAEKEDGRELSREELQWMVLREIHHFRPGAWIFGGSST